MSNPIVIRPVTIRHVSNEVPVGLLDGSNLVYTTEFNFSTSTLKVYLNGLRLKEGGANDYVVSGINNFTMNYAPLPGDEILVDYIKRLD